MPRTDLTPPGIPYARPTPPMPRMGFIAPAPKAPPPMTPAARYAPPVMAAPAAAPPPPPFAPSPTLAPAPPAPSAIPAAAAEIIARTPGLDAKGRAAVIQMHAPAPSPVSPPAPAPAFDLSPLPSATVGIGYAPPEAGPPLTPAFDLSPMPSATPGVGYAPPESIEVEPTAPRIRAAVAAGHAMGDEHDAIAEADRAAADAEAQLAAAQPAARAAREWMDAHPGDLGGARIRGFPDAARRAEDLQRIATEKRQAHWSLLSQRSDPAAAAAGFNDDDQERLRAEAMQLHGGRYDPARVAALAEYRLARGRAAGVQYLRLSPAAMDAAGKPHVRAAIRDAIRASDPRVIAVPGRDDEYYVDPAVLPQGEGAELANTFRQAGHKATSGTAQTVRGVRAMATEAAASFADQWGFPLSEKERAAGRTDAADALRGVGKDLEAEIRQGEQERQDFEAQYPVRTGAGRMAAGLLGDAPKLALAGAAGPGGAAAIFGADAAGNQMTASLLRGEKPDEAAARSLVAMAGTALVTRLAPTVGHVHARTLAGRAIASLGHGGGTMYALDVLGQGVAAAGRAGEDVRWAEPIFHSLLTAGIFAAPGLARGVPKEAPAAEGRPAPGVGARAADVRTFGDRNPPPWERGRSVQDFAGGEPGRTGGTPGPKELRSLSYGGGEAESGRTVPERKTQVDPAGGAETGGGEVNPVAPIREEPKGGGGEGRQQEVPRAIVDETAPPPTADPPAQAGRVGEVVAGDTARGEDAPVAPAPPAGGRVIDKSFADSFKDAKGVMDWGRVSDAISEEVRQAIARGVSVTLTRPGGSNPVPIVSVNERGMMVRGDGLPQGALGIMNGGERLEMRPARAAADATRPAPAAAPAVDLTHADRGDLEFVAEDTRSTPADREAARAELGRRAQQDQPPAPTVPDRTPPKDTPAAAPAPDAGQSPAARQGASPEQPRPEPPKAPGQPGQQEQGQGGGDHVEHPGLVAEGHGGGSTPGRQRVEAKKAELARLRAERAKGKETPVVPEAPKTPTEPPPAPVTLDRVGTGKTHVLRGAAKDPNGPFAKAGLKWNDKQGGYVIPGNRVEEVRGMVEGKPKPVPKFFHPEAEGIPNRSQTGIFGQTVVEPQGGTQAGMFHEPVEVARPTNETGADAAARRRNENDPTQQTLPVPRGADAVPPGVLDTVRRAVDGLKEIDRVVEENRRVKGEHNADLIREQQRERADGHRATIEKFRGLAEKNGIDADRVLDEMGLPRADENPLPEETVTPDVPPADKSHGKAYDADDALPLLDWLDANDPEWRALRNQLDRAGGAARDDVRDRIGRHLDRVNDTIERDGVYHARATAADEADAGRDHQGDPVPGVHEGSGDGDRGALPEAVERPKGKRLSRAAIERKLLDEYNRSDGAAFDERRAQDEAEADATGVNAQVFKREPKTKSGYPEDVENAFTKKEFAQLRRRGIIRLAEESRGLTGGAEAGGEDARSEIGGMGIDRFNDSLRRLLEDTGAGRLRAAVKAGLKSPDPEIRALAEQWTPPENKGTRKVNTKPNLTADTPGATAGEPPKTGKLDALEDWARRKLDEMGGPGARTGVDPFNDAKRVALMTTIAAARIGKGAVRFADFVKAMVEEVPELAGAARAKMIGLFTAGRRMLNLPELSREEEFQKAFGPLREGAAEGKTLGVADRKVPTNDSDADAHERAVREFGLTADHREAGYVLPDGRMLDMSGRRDAIGYDKATGKPLPGKPDYLKGNRNVDHREVHRIYDPKEDGSTDGGDSMSRFMASGAARVDFHAGTVNITRPLTAAQTGEILRGMRRTGMDSFSVDVDDATGNTLAGIEIAGMAGLGRVLREASRLASGAPESPKGWEIRRPPPEPTPSKSADFASDVFDAARAVETENGPGKGGVAGAGGKVRIGEVYDRYVRDHGPMPLDEFKAKVRESGLTMVGEDLIPDEQRAEFERSTLNVGGKAGADYHYLRTDPASRPKAQNVGQRLVADATAKLDALRDAKAARANAARAKGKRPGTAQGPFDPDEWALMAQIGVGHIMDGAIRFGEWSAKMVKELPELASAGADAMRGLFARAREEAKAEGIEVGPEEGVVTTEGGGRTGREARAAEAPPTTTDAETTRPSPEPRQGDPSTQRAPGVGESSRPKVPDAEAHGTASPDSTASEPDVTSIKNAKVAKERERAGLPPRIKPPVEGFDPVWREARRRVDADPNLSRDTVARFKANPELAANQVEQDLILHRRIELADDVKRLTKERNAAREAGDLDGEAKLTDELDAANAGYKEAIEVGERIGTTTGRTLANRKKYVDTLTFDLAHMIETESAAKGRKLTPAETAEVEVLHKRIEDAEAAHQAELAKKDERLAELQSKLDHAEKVRAAQAPPKQQQKAPGRKYGSANRIVSREAYEKALGELRSATFSIGGVLPVAVKAAAFHLEAGARSFADFSTRMIADVGEKIRPHLDELYAKASAMIAGEERKRLVDGMKARLKVDGPGADLTRYVGELHKTFIAEQLAAGGKSDRDASLEKVHEVLAPLMPDGWSKADTRDAMSGRGRTIELSQDEISVAKRKEKGELLALGHLEGLAKTPPEAPPHTGLQRDKPGTEKRQLDKRVRDEMRRLGITETDPEKMLAGTLDRIKTGLKNEIEDLDFQIASGKRSPDDVRTPVEYDAEAADLKAQRDAKRATLDELFPEETSAADEAAKVRALEQAVERINKKLADNDLAAAPGAKAGPDSAAVAKLKAERDVAAAELAARRKAAADAARDPNTAAADDLAEQRRLQKSIDANDAKIARGDVAAPGAVAGPDSAETARLKAENAASRKRLAELRAAAKGPPSYEDQLARVLKATEARAQAARERLADAKAGNWRKPDGQKVTGPEVEAMRAQVDAANAEVAALRAIDPVLAESRRVRALEAQLDRIINPPGTAGQAEPAAPDSPRAAALKAEIARLKAANEEGLPARRTPEEVAIAVARAAKTRQIADYADRLARGDFAAKRPAKAPVVDDGVVRLAKIADDARRAWLNRQRANEARNRSTLRKAADTAMEAFALPRTLMTSFDLSAVLRQGGFIAMGHPLRAARSIVPMLKAFGSEYQAYKVETEIKNRPNAPLYERAKLYLAERDAGLSKQEEGFMSRWAGKIPGVKASERAYVAFLNRLRADSFDAMAATLSRKGAPTDLELKAIANYVNVATGRGGLGKFANAAPLLNTVFFAPRNLVSRFQLLAGQPLYGGSAATRKLIAGEYARYLLGVTAAYALAYAAGGDVEKDPRSTDFGKMRFGDTRLDPLTGLQQATVLLSRLATGETKTPVGNVVPNRGEAVPHKGDTGWDLTMKFARSKFSPLMGTLVDLEKGKDFENRPLTPGSVAKNLLVPMGASDIAEVMTDKGVPKGTIFAAMSLLGMGLQHYPYAGGDPRAKAKAEAQQGVLNLRAELSQPARDLLKEKSHLDGLGRAMTADERQRWRKLVAIEKKYEVMQRLHKAGSAAGVKEMQRRIDAAAAAIPAK